LMGLCGKKGDVRRGIPGNLRAHSGGELFGVRYFRNQGVCGEWGRRLEGGTSLGKPLGSLTPDPAELCQGRSESCRGTGDYRRNESGGGKSSRHGV